MDGNLNSREIAGEIVMSGEFSEGIEADSSARIGIARSGATNYDR
jgi:hypothetical protein